MVLINGDEYLEIIFFKLSQYNLLNLVIYLKLILKLQQVEIRLYWLLNPSLGKPKKMLDQAWAQVNCELTY